MSASQLPWHAAQWARFNAMLDQDRVHHAWLLSGAPGLGKRAFAERAARALLCEAAVAAPERPCGECRSCQLDAAGSHPDRIVIAPPEDRSIIGVDQVRARTADLSLTAHYAGRRVALVMPADALNRHAADSLLKTLEEPTAAVVFLLVTSRPSALPVTVRSRCLRLDFQAGEPAESQAWLAAQGVGQAGDLLAWCGGAPLAALAAHEENLADALAGFADQLAALIEGRLGALEVAQSWRALGLDTALDWQLRVATALMQRAAGKSPTCAELATKRIPRGLDLMALNQLCDELLEYRAACDRQINPNEQLALEHLAASWTPQKPG